MSDGQEVERFVKDPSLLVDLCREVIDELDASNDDSDIGEREAQLREIAKTIERLEKAGVSVPEVLRGEKTRLAASLAVHADSTQALAQLADAFGDILKELKARLGHEQNTTVPKAKGKKSRAPKTDKMVLRTEIIRALKTLGGSARAADVIKQMGRQLEGKLLPGDLERHAATNGYLWQYLTQWERLRMTKDGTLRSDSPYGTWELPENAK
jgi:HPt (histidine-containing phosphotransfer) domain-containing protein